MPTIHKVMAYITRHDELLIFREPDFPEAALGNVPSLITEHDDFVPALR